MTSSFKRTLRKALKENTEKSYKKDLKRLIFSELENTGNSDQKVQRKL